MSANPLPGRNRWSLHNEPETQNLYTHVFDELSRDAAEKIADVIPRNLRRPTR
jgi:hypothetical protein